MSLSAAPGEVGGADAGDGAELGDDRDHRACASNDFKLNSACRQELTCCITQFHHKRLSGRLREIAFRQVGEGTGKRRDIDGFDAFEFSSACVGFLVGGCDLYLYDAEGEEGERLTQVSAGEVAPGHAVPGQGANVGGCSATRVTRMSKAKSTSA